MYRSTQTGLDNSAISMGLPTSDPLHSKRMSSSQCTKLSIESADARLGLFDTPTFTNRVALIMCGLFVVLLLTAIVCFSSVSARTMPGMAITVQRSSRGGEFLEPHSIHQSLWEADRGSYLISDAHSIFKVKPTTRDWLAFESEVIIGIQPGYGTGDFTHARFDHIVDFVQSDDGEKIYISDDQNHCIRVADRTTKQVTPFAGNCTNSGNTTGTYLDTSFTFQKEIIFSNDRKHMFIADYYNDRIVHLDNTTGISTAIFEHNKDFRAPQGLAAAPDSTTVYVTTQTGVHKILEPHTANAQVVLVTDSVKGGADLKLTPGKRMLIITDFLGDQLLFRDLNSGLEASFCVKPRSTSVESFDGPSNECYLKGPQGIAIVNSNSLLVSEHHAKIRKITFSHNVITTPDPSLTTPKPHTVKPTTKTLTAGSTAPYPHKSTKSRGHIIEPNTSPPRPSSALAIALGTLIPLLLIGGIAGCLTFIICRQKRMHARERQQMYERRSRQGGFNGPAFSADPKYIDSFHTSAQPPPYNSNQDEKESSLPSYSTGSYDGETAGATSGASQI